MIPKERDFPISAIEEWNRKGKGDRDGTDW
jgi:hypothetical protein